MQVAEAIVKRSSIRDYKETAVPEDKLNRVLEAARLAPTGANRQDIKFVVVRNKEARRRLMQASGNQRHVGQAPVVIAAVATDPERIMECGQEHPGGVHVHPKEGQAVGELFNRYASGTTTLAQLAAWLNVNGFRTRDRHKLPDANGNLTAGPRLFTTASVRGILHNPFYCGLITHSGKTMPGVHEPLISRELFDNVQILMKKNSGRSETLLPRPARQYLLKGIIRCAYCGMPMWAQTYKSGRRYYREHEESRSSGALSGQRRAYLLRSCR